MALYKCLVCDNIYDEAKEGTKWDDLPEDWVCPVCASAKSLYELVEDTKITRLLSELPRSGASPPSSPHEAIMNRSTNNKYFFILKMEAID